MPSDCLTIEDAETAAARRIGARGTVARLATSNDADRDQRRPVKAWLRANGVPSAVSKFLSVEDLAAVWNDTTNARLAELQARDTDTTTTDQGAGEIAGQDMQLNLIHKREADEAQRMTIYTPPAGDAAALMMQAIALMQAQQKAPVDADMVERIAQAAVDRAVNLPRALTVTVADTSRTLPAAHRHALFPDVLAFVANDEPVALIGPAGSGKTTLAEQVAAALGLAFYAQNAVTGAHELSGFVDGAGRYHTTPFRAAFETGGVFLLDEIDGSPDPAALLFMNAGLANGFCSFPDQAEPVRRHPDFRAIAGANTYWTGADRVYVGRTQLDGATADRFAFLSMDYDEALERALAGNDVWCSYVQQVRAAVASLQIRHIVSPRATFKGAKMLAAGMARDKVEAAYIWKGMSAADAQRIRAAVRQQVAA